MNLPGRLHWVVFFWPVFFLLIGVSAYLQTGLIHQLGFPMLFIGTILGVLNIVAYLFTQLIITERSIIIRRGIIVRQSLEIPYRKIESIHIEQTIIGQWLDYGVLVVTGTGGSHNPISPIAMPKAYRREIEEKISQHT